MLPEYSLQSHLFAFYSLQSHLCVALCNPLFVFYYCTVPGAVLVKTGVLRKIVSCRAFSCGQTKNDVSGVSYYSKLVYRYSNRRATVERRRLPQSC